MGFKSRDFPNSVNKLLGIKTKRKRLEPIMRPLLEEKMEQTPNGLKWTLPILVVSDPNQREHWTDRHKRVAKVRETLGLFLMAEASKQNRLKNIPKSITFTRVGRRLLDKAENLPASFKSCADELCEFWNVRDDATCPIEFRFDQRQTTGALGIELLFGGL